MDEERKYRIKTFLKDGVREGVFPGAVLLAAQKGQVLIHEEIGHLSLVPEAFPMKRDTIFDLASLTKPLATTLAIMKLVDEGRIDIDQTLDSLLTCDVPKDKRTLTPRLLLCHCAGFADWKPFYLELQSLEVEKRKESLRERLLNMQLVYRPGDETLYSDLGFMFLEWVIEERAGMPFPMYLEQHFYIPLSLNNTFFSSDILPAGFTEDQFAATEDCPWRKKIVSGYVHDENAYALGGYSGHAGPVSYTHLTLPTN